MLFAVLPPTALMQILISSMPQDVTDSRPREQTEKRRSLFFIFFDIRMQNDLCWIRCRSEIGCEVRTDPLPGVGGKAKTEAEAKSELFSPKM